MVMVVSPTVRLIAPLALPLVTAVSLTSMVAPSSLAVGVTVTLVTRAATLAVYMVVPAAKGGTSVPSDMVSPLSVLSLEGVGASSSVMVSVRLAGRFMPTLLDAVAEMVTCLSAASTLLSTAVIVTTSVLAVSPAPMVSVVVELRL